MQVQRIYPTIVVKESQRPGKVTFIGEERTVKQAKADLRGKFSTTSDGIAKHATTPPDRTSEGNEITKKDLSIPPTSKLEMPSTKSDEETQVTQGLHSLDTQPKKGSVPKSELNPTKEPHDSMTTNKSPSTSPKYLEALKAKHESPGQSKPQDVFAKNDNPQETTKLPESRAQSQYAKLPNDSSNGQSASSKISSPQGESSDASILLQKKSGSASPSRESNQQTTQKLSRFQQLLDTFDLAKKKNLKTEKEKEKLKAKAETHARHTLEEESPVDLDRSIVTEPLKTSAKAFETRQTDVKSTSEAREALRAGAGNLTERLTSKKDTGMAMETEATHSSDVQASVALPMYDSADEWSDDESVEDENEQMETPKAGEAMEATKDEATKSLTDMKVSLDTEEADNPPKHRVSGLVAKFEEMKLPERITGHSSMDSPTAHASNKRTSKIASPGATTEDMKISQDAAKESTSFPMKTTPGLEERSSKITSHDAMKESTDYPIKTVFGVEQGFGDETKLEDTEESISSHMKVSSGLDVRKLHDANESGADPSMLGPAKTPPGLERKSPDQSKFDTAIRSTHSSSLVPDKAALPSDGGTCETTKLDAKKERDVSACGLDATGKTSASPAEEGPEMRKITEDTPASPSAAAEGQEMLTMTEDSDIVKAILIQELIEAGGSENAKLVQELLDKEEGYHGDHGTGSLDLEEILAMGAKDQRKHLAQCDQGLMKLLSMGKYASASTRAHLEELLELRRKISADPTGRIHEMLKRSESPAASGTILPAVDANEMLISEKDAILRSFKVVEENTIMFGKMKEEYEKRLAEHKKKAIPEIVVDEDGDSEERRIKGKPLKDYPDVKKSFTGKDA